MGIEIGRPYSWYEPEDPGVICCEGCGKEIQDREYYEFDSSCFCKDCVKSWEEQHLVEV